RCSTRRKQFQRRGWPRRKAYGNGSGVRRGQAMRPVTTEKHDKPGRCATRAACERDLAPRPLISAVGIPLGNVAFLVPGVPVALRATKPEFRCEQGDPLPAQLRGRRRKLNLSVEEAAAMVGVRRWTFGLWE